MDDATHEFSSQDVSAADLCERIQSFMVSSRPRLVSAQYGAANVWLDLRDALQNLLNQAVLSGAAGGGAQLSPNQVMRIASLAEHKAKVPLTDQPTLEIEYRRDTKEDAPIIFAVFDLESNITL